MGKVFGILLIVVAVWVGLTIFNEGTDAAFGGLDWTTPDSLAPGQCRTAAPLRRLSRASPLAARLSTAPPTASFPSRCLSR